MTIKMVLFDCDSVIVDSERTTNLSLLENLARHGLALSLEELLSLFVGRAMKTAGDEARRGGAELPDSWPEDFYPELYDRLGKEVEVIHGVPEVLDALDQAGIPYAVCSNGRIRKMKAMLTRIGLWDRLKDHLYSAQEMNVPKPAPDVYLKAAADYGCTQQDCVVIEDSVTGLRVANAVGACSFGYSRIASAAN